MQTKIINGKEIADKVKEKVRKEVEELKANNIFPKLVVVIVGENPASRVYVNSKKKNCEALGIDSIEITLPQEVVQEELLSVVEKLNADSSVSGILVQLPLPKHIDENLIIDAIDPKKDVDGFHPINVGKLMIGQDTLESCTPAGIMRILEEINVNISGKHCVVIGRSNIVGKPVAQMLLKKNGTVTICHSKTENLPEICKQADILIAAVGRERMVDRNYVKDGAIVIDVGINRGKDGKLYGDVNFEDIQGIAAAVTPVPGGVGAMTIAMLMENTVKCAKQNSTLTE